jgi:hypothetical protein
VDSFDFLKNRRELLAHFKRFQCAFDTSNLNQDIAEIIWGIFDCGDIALQAVIIWFESPMSAITLAVRLRGSIALEFSCWIVSFAANSIYE